MTNVTLDAVLRRPGILVPGKTDQGSDAELLQRFVHQHDESAFMALLQRHGPMVLNVCRYGVRHPQDAEDAFQATFLVLAANARSIRQPGSVASWLHEVAQRIAAQVRVEATRWQVWPLEESVVSSVNDLSDVAWSELRAVVDDELSQLSEKYRASLVLCYLEERTQEEAARALGWSKSTIRRRLDRGLELLRARLTRRGATLSAGLLATLGASRPVAASLSADLVGSTVKAGMLVAVRTAASTVGVSARVVMLLEKAIKVLALSRPGLPALLLLAVPLDLAGAGLLAHSILPAPPPHPPGEQPQPMAEARPSKPGEERPDFRGPFTPEPGERLRDAKPGKRRLPWHAWPGDGLPCLDPMACETGCDHALRVVRMAWVRRTGLPAPVGAGGRGDRQGSCDSGR